MKEINFYLDETFHSRNTTKKSFKEHEYFNNFIIGGIGVEEAKKTALITEYEKYEKKYKKLYDLSLNEELKSELLRPKKYKYGLKTFKNDDISLYSDFFDILIENNTVYYLSVTNDIENIIRILVLSSARRIGLSKEIVENLVYTITKAINLYKPVKIYDDLIEKNEDIFNDLILFFSECISKNKLYAHKKIENAVFECTITLLAQLGKANYSRVNYRKNYWIHYLGLKLLFKEKEYSMESSLIIDEEKGCLRAAKINGFINAKEADSKVDIRVRIADMFIGFFARMMRALYVDIAGVAKTSDPSLKYLSPNWFDIDEKRFNLYKKICTYIDNKTYYSTFACAYPDTFIYVVSLIYYISSYDNFEKFKNVKDHPKKLNDETLKRLDDFYKKFSNAITS